MNEVSTYRHGDGGHVAEVVLDRPEAMNALSTAMARKLTHVCDEVARDADVRAVVLSATGEKAFCVGADLKERRGFTDADLLAQRPVFRAAFGGLLRLPQPTVAAVHGYALGGGFELALSCDLLVADDTAVFGLPETSVGLVPGGGGTQLAPRRLGPAVAADLIFTARRFGVDEAQRLGLVTRRVGDPGAEAAGEAASGAGGPARDEALALAGRIAANSPTGVRAAKRALRHGAGVDLEAGLDVEDAAWRTAALSADRREGIAAFNQKRPPEWTGE